RLVRLDGACGRIFGGALGASTQREDQGDNKEDGQKWFHGSLLTQIPLLAKEGRETPGGQCDQEVTPVGPPRLRLRFAWRSLPSCARRGICQQKRYHRSSLESDTMAVLVFLRGKSRSV